MQVSTNAEVAACAFLVGSTTLQKNFAAESIGKDANNLSTDDPKNEFDAWDDKLLIGQAGIQLCRVWASHCW